jgi:DNA-binding GntR family transcriptional regulator
VAKLDALHAQRERYVRVYTQALVHAHGLGESVDEHDAIVAAIQAGDANAAERAAAFNYRHALARYDRMMPA